MREKISNKEAKTDKEEQQHILDTREELFNSLIAQEEKRYNNAETTKEQHDRNIIRLEIAKLNEIIKLRAGFGMDVSDMEQKLAEQERKYAEAGNAEDLAEFNRKKAAAERAHEEHIIDLTRRYTEEKDVCDNYQNDVMESELALLVLLREFRLQYGMDTLDIDKQIADKEKEIFDYRTQNAEDFAKDLDKKLGKRERNFITKFISLNRQIKEVQNDTILSTEQKKAKIDTLKQSLADMNKAEALSWAQSAQSAVSGAETFQEATAAVLNSIRDRISAYLAEAVAAVIAKEMASKGLLGVITAGLAAAAVTMFFNTLIPKFGVHFDRFFHFSVRKHEFIVV